MSSTSAPGRSPGYYHAWAACLIVGSALLRLAYLAWYSPLDLAPDEAHYWDWSRHLDWSYYSKGPLVALLIRGSCMLFGPLSLALTGGEMLAVRMPAVVCGALLVTSLYVLTVRVHGPGPWGVLLVVGLLTFPAVAAGSSLMTIDAPFLCLWGWALVTAHAALFRDTRGAWVATGVLVGLGVLAKHVMVLWLPFFGLFLLFTPALRHNLLRRGFWVMAALGLCGALPILGWNAFNGWVTLWHTRGHAGLSSRRLVHWSGPFVYFGTQFALLFGFWFIAWARAAVHHHPLRETRPVFRFLWWMSAPVILFFGLFSLKNGGGEPNWPLAGYLAGTVLLVGWLADRVRTAPPWRRAGLVSGCAGFGLLGLFVTVVIHDPVRFQGLFALVAGETKFERPMPLRRVDPTCRLRGWQTLARAVDAVRAELRAQGIEPVLAATTWSMPGEIGFYCEGHPTVYSVGLAMGERHSQYDLWHPNPVADPGAFLGKTFLIIGLDATSLSHAFDRIDAARVVDHREGAHRIASWNITVCHGFRGIAGAARSGGF